MIVCGLDISTSCIGICILNTKENTQKFSSISPKGNSWLEKAQSVKPLLEDLFLENKIEKVYIEENLQAFRPGLSSAKTLMSLSRFNGIVSFMIMDNHGIEPEFLNVNSARKSLGIKIERKSHKSTKEQVLDWVNSQINFDWPTRIMKSGKRKGEEVLRNDVYDMADAFVIARAGVL